MRCLHSRLRDASLLSTSLCGQSRNGVCRFHSRDILIPTGLKPGNSEPYKSNARSGRLSAGQYTVPMKSETTLTLKFTNQSHANGLC